MVSMVTCLKDVHVDYYGVSDEILTVCGDGVWNWERLEEWLTLMKDTSLKNSSIFLSAVSSGGGTTPISMSPWAPMGRVGGGALPPCKCAILSLPAAVLCLPSESFLLLTRCEAGRHI